ncbi:MAG: hypothetical protein M1838_001340 [Thelocarpon superellum]|nr:MAG: hypothetical protein M1838_001340 [Thelocarpon superellum]
MSGLLSKAYWGLALAGAVYMVGLATLTTEWAQREALYAHRFHTLWWHDLDKPEQFGFAKNQVTPFYLSTSDGERLYAYHILPPGVCAHNEASLIDEPIGLAPDVSRTEAFRLLQTDPNSRLVISFHGNAGHLGQGWRTDTWRALAAAGPDTIHVLTIDYRGYGHSTGRPSEAGLIQDGIAAVTWAMDVARIPSSRIVLVGQSLGTAVTAAVAEHFATATIPVEFAAEILIAPFTDLPGLLLTYSIKGVLPLLSPLRTYPFLQKWVLSRILDTWKTKQRIERLVRASSSLHLHLIHAINDVEIPWRHSDTLYRLAVNATKPEGYTARQLDQAFNQADRWEGGWVNEWTTGKKSIREEIVRHGGHNRIATYSAVTLAVYRALYL